MMISTLKVGLAGAIALVVLVPSALASSVNISTDRVQVQVGNNGQVYIRSLVDSPAGSAFDQRPAGLPRVTLPQMTNNLRLPTATFVPRCTARSYSDHSTRSTARGDVIYSENRSTTQVCQ
ncbi:hypothetical protein IQ254_16605 [Nodosilinea sp. LEGE 07088]|uniref:hypothetical protein n=1 Tax=Nodosilinea sp. LEGE 07088 TaxID=2777968 RepID=UPI00187FD73F|nr:hypothetical protein [Nodosilinea sp. LEGE 07088]MBE9138794.1 hypothetical protein [Nodosilinea sp. LEGE 07088]